MILFPSDCKRILCALLCSTWPAQSPKECGVCDRQEWINEWKKDWTGKRLCVCRLAPHSMHHCMYIFIICECGNFCRPEMHWLPFWKTSMRRTTLLSSCLIVKSPPGRTLLPKQQRKMCLKPLHTSENLRTVEVRGNKWCQLYSKCFVHFLIQITRNPIYKYTFYNLSNKSRESLMTLISALHYKPTIQTSCEVNTESRTGNNRLKQCLKTIQIFFF